SFLDVATHFPELLLVDDGTYVACLIERITELERFDLLPERIEKIVEDVAVQEEAGARSAGLAFPGGAQRRQDSIDKPILVPIREDDRGAPSPKLKRRRHDAV